MKYQIRRIISFICILACGFNLVSCAKNPEKRIVVDKAEGLSKENVLPNEKDVPKDLGAPEHWQETMDRSNGFVTIEQTARCGYLKCIIRLCISIKCVP